MKIDKSENLFLERAIKYDTYKWYALAVVQLSILLVGVDSTITNLALPNITKSFSCAISESEWVISAFFIAVAVALPAAGRISDLFGRRSVFISGFALFTISSALCGLAPNIYFLIAMRIVQGVGGAALLANSNVISLAVFPIKEHGIALGINGTVYSIGYALGYTLGGQLINSFGWRSIFYLNVPTGMLAIYLGLIIIKEKYLKPNEESEKDKSLDLEGFILSAIGIGSTMYAIVRISSEKSISFSIVFLLIGGLVALLLFVKIELSSKHPLLDIRLFKISEFARGAFTRLLNNSIVAACTFAIPFYTQLVLKFTAFQSGLVMLPYALGLATIGPISGKLSDRYGPRWLTTMGFISGGIALIGLESIGGGSSNDLEVKNSVVKTIIAMFLLGSASGLFVSPNNSSSLDAVPLNRTGSASGVIWSVSFIGSALGTAYAASMLRSVLVSNIPVARYLESQSLLFNTLIILSFAGGYLCFTRKKNQLKQH
jgi:EmrB/QacA subfamily drug resistance transporter